ncbi:MAG: hypothetical protein Q4D91_14045 [Lautropia sp.]|nr:hypothetical protein [Lautropia sp.]
MPSLRSSHVCPLTILVLSALSGCQGAADLTPLGIKTSSGFTSSSPAVSLRQSHAQTPGIQSDTVEEKPSVSVISAQGIRGDVLAQVLRTETNRQSGEQPRFTQAMPWAEVASEAPAAQSTFYIDQRILPDGNQQPGAYVYSTRSFTLGAEHKQATLELTLGLSAEKGEAGTETLQLGKHLAMQLSPGIHQQATQPPVSTRVAARSTLSLHEQMLLTWDTPIQTWGRPDGDHVELSVMPGRSEREFGVCFSARLHTLYRRQSCSLWQLPPNWQAGQTLAYQGHYLQETGPAMAGAETAAPAPIAFETRRWLSSQQIHVALDTSATPAALSQTTLAARATTYPGH